MRASPLLGLAFGATSALASLQIVPGATWTASNGEHIQAHGAGIIKVDDLYYLIGEDKTNGTYFLNVNCYSSPNLVDWTYVGALLSQESSGDLGPGRVVERPKVIYNDDTQQFVLWMHIDSSSYGEAATGVASGASVCGEYTYHGSFQPLGFQSRDMGLFKDTDGSAYLLTEDRDNGLRIDALTDDYLNVTGDASVYVFEEKYESPAMIKTADGTYVMLASQLTGWDPNDNFYATAQDLAGPWTEWQRFADEGSNTYASQTTFVLPVDGTDGTAYVYLGDRWESDALFRSTYVWLPLSLSGAGDATTVRVENHVNWVLDVAAGTWAAGPAETQYEGEDGTLAGGAEAVACEGCSGGDAAGYVGGEEGGTVTFAAVSSEAETRSTVRIKYQNLDAGERYAGVRVGDGEAVKVAFLPTVQGTPGTSVVHLDLVEGEANEVVIEGWEGEGYGPDVDRLMVPVN